MKIYKFDSGCQLILRYITFTIDWSYSQLKFNFEFNTNFDWAYLLIEIPFLSIQLSTNLLRDIRTFFNKIWSKLNNRIKSTNSTQSNMSKEEFIEYVRERVRLNQIEKFKNHKTTHTINWYFGCVRIYTDNINFMNFGVECVISSREIHISIQGLGKYIECMIRFPFKFWKYSIKIVKN